jgi:DNA-binding response OmpR family regulator
VSSDQESAHRLAEMLRAEEHYIAMANGGQSGLEWNLDFRPDIVLIDLRLAGADAYSLAQSFRAQPNRESVTMVCVCEWRPEAENPKGWKEAGFSYHLQVPADEGDLELMFGFLGIPQDPSWKENRYSPRRILIVEHDQETAEGLAVPLRKMGNHVEIVPDGCGALEAERSFRPDVVLIEPRLPDMDFCALARSIRAQPSLRKVALVFLLPTGFTKDDWKRGRETGFQCGLKIPADLIDLQLMFVNAGMVTESAADAANSTTRLYNKGPFSPKEFIFRLIQRAAKHDPAEMVTAMKAIWDASSCGQTLEEFLEEMRTYATEPPSHPSQISQSWWEGTGSRTKGENMQTSRQNAYDGWWRWFRYFNG